MLAIAGLALDTSHALANKTRLQSTTDAAALAAAKTYDDLPDIAAANAAARTVFGLNADGAGNHELNAAFDASEIAVTIQWSETLYPFVSTGVGPYVRVIATGYSIGTSLSAVLGVSEIDIAASAVAGPSPTIDSACDLAPIIACALDPNDRTNYGFEPYGVQVLKGASGGQDPIGPGNFQLARLNCPGGDCVRENVAGGYQGCVSVGDRIQTEPGNTIGPTVQGLNTRFGEYLGMMSPERYPPDVVTREPNPALRYDDKTDRILQNNKPVTANNLGYSWGRYQFDLAHNRLTDPPPVGAFERRILALPIARCSGNDAGLSTLEVLGLGCYFLLQRTQYNGRDAHVFGQFVGGCNVNGSPGPAPGDSPGPYIIQLYKDPDSADS